MIKRQPQLVLIKAPLNKVVKKATVHSSSTHLENYTQEDYYELALPETYPHRL